MSINSRIIKDFFSEYSQKFSIVETISYEDSPTAFGLSAIKISQKTTQIPEYEHFAIKTKEYRDINSATYKLFKSIEKAFNGLNNGHKIFIRSYPIVRKAYCFDRNYPTYSGLARISIEKD